MPYYEALGESNRAEVKTWNNNIRESVWFYAWEVDNGSDLFIKETNGKVSREEDRSLYGLI